MPQPNKQWIKLIFTDIKQTFNIPSGIRYHMHIKIKIDFDYLVIISFWI